MRCQPLLLVILLLHTLPLAAQSTYPIDDYDGQTIATCSGTFVDSSLGDSLDHYSPNEDYQLTFTSDDEENPYLYLDFEFFQLGQHDTLYVYDGADDTAPLLTAATGQTLAFDTIYASADSLHFHFVSSDFDPEDSLDVADRLGWQAQISCAALCDLMVVDIDPLDGLMHCPETVGMVSFEAAAYYLHDDLDTDLSYSWTIEDESLAGETIAYDFENTPPGAYPIHVTATDTENDCQASAVEVLMIATIPSLEGTTAGVDSACAGETFTLFGEATPTIWTGFPTVVEEEPPFLLEEGTVYSSTLTFDVFDEGVEVLSEDDFDRVCVYIEHVDQAHLRFELEAPSGEVIELKDMTGPEANLGEPVEWDDEIPGTGYEYCFSPLPQYGTMAETNALTHEYTDNAGNYYAVADYMPPGSYTPIESLGELAGSTLNGTWTMWVEDGFDESAGHLFSWSLYFDDMFYPDSLIFTPEIVEEQWYHNDTPIDGNPATTSIDDPGDHDFTFEVMDDFGCVYDTTTTVHILPLPKAEIESELEIPICEGDSTLLTVHPIDDDGTDWIYQWQYAGADMPDRTYDTLMVKEPGLYTVMISDTITGCIDFFDKDVTDQNCDLTIPNVFTPNDDGINDEFEIENLEHYPNARMVIYNRWGEKVFEHNDYYNNWWDGRGAPDGTYFYVLQYTRMGETRYTEGSVTIIR